MLTKKIKTKDSVGEKCVCCGKPVGYDPLHNVEIRAYFVEGAGQLCPECYDKIYKVSENAEHG